MNWIHSTAGVWNELDSQYCRGLEWTGSTVLQGSICTWSDPGYCWGQDLIWSTVLQGSDLDQTCNFIIIQSAQYKKLTSVDLTVADHFPQSFKYLQRPEQPRDYIKLATLLEYSLHHTKNWLQCRASCDGEYYNYAVQKWHHDHLPRKQGLEVSTCL